jgi:uncharacterized protein
MNKAGPSELPDAFFLETDEGQRFCLFYPGHAHAVRDPLLFLHPFAEELNTTRRIVAQQARALARAGHPVLQIDLGGCGDSEGLFENATWVGWCQDARMAQAWLRGRTGRNPWLWGLRAGALLASQLVSENPASGRLLLWQPVTHGEQTLQQFLRLASASQWIDKQKTSTPPPAQTLRQGQPVTIAGYTLNPQLAHDLSQVRVAPEISHRPGQIIWLEVASQAEPQLSPAAARQLENWRAVGWKVHSRAVRGPAFWQSVGLEDAPALIDATQLAIDQMNTPTSA